MLGKFHFSETKFSNFLIRILNKTICEPANRNKAIPEDSIKEADKDQISTVKQQQS